MGIEPTRDGIRPPSVLKTERATRLRTTPVSNHSRIIFPASDKEFTSSSIFETLPTAK